MRRRESAQARRREVREGMERQFRESMAAPDWELEDYDWCRSVQILCYASLQRVIDTHMRGR